MIEFSSSITYGETFVGLSGLCAAASFLFRKGGSTARLEVAVERALTEISELKEDVSQVNQILTKLAVQNERLDTMNTRLNTMDRRYDELRRGQGWITNPRTVVDGEY